MFLNPSYASIVERQRIESQEKGKYREGKTPCTSLYGIQPRRARPNSSLFLSEFGRSVGRTLITRKRSYGSTLVENPSTRPSSHQGAVRPW